MQYGYVVKISNKNIYREVQLPVDAEYLKVGLGIDCDVRFFKEDFFDDFELVFRKVNGAWQIECSDNLYLDSGDVQKLMTKKLSHGDSFAVKYQESESELFKIDFLFDFDNENKDYERCINISGVSSFYIGSGSGYDILLNSEYVKNDLIQLQKVNNGDLQLIIKQTTYGVYHNGKLAKNGETICNGDFFSIANFSFYFKNGLLRTSKDVNSNLNYYDDLNKNEYPKFNRNTRVKIVVDDEKIEVLDPPAKPQKPRNNILTRLLPSAVMIVAGIAMITISPFMLISSGVGVVTAIVSIVQSKKEFKQNSKERIEKYKKYIENKKIEIEKYRDVEQQVLNEIYLDQEQTTSRLTGFSTDLFDREKDDEDFLQVRLGIGSKEAIKEVSYKKQERLEVEDDLQEMPQKICEEYKLVHNAPITVDLKETGAMGIIGPEQYRFAFMKNMLVDICARQFYSDVNLFFVVENEHEDKVHWLRMLPYVFNDVIGIRNIISDDDSKNILFEYLYKELTIRKEEKEENPKRIIVFFYDEYEFKNHPISKFVDDAKELGITFIFFKDKKSDVIQGCDYLVDIKSDREATLIQTDDRSKALDFRYTTVSDAQAKDIVDMLAPVYTEEISLEGALTKNISLFQLLNIIAVDDIDLDGRWNTSQVFKSMSAPIGVSKSNVISLDLHDKAHGPHGLVAGTTGSGKSEILQTYVLSMATLFHPYEVGFVIIDFKGGGMANQFRDLPHLMGAITNIDGKEIDRSLKSIKAELQKRQKYFAEADVNHIDAYIKKYKAGEVKEPLPHLILIVDEFAELKAEQPEFMKELISAARIGRSLGVHLILATQKPSGQVNEQIWSNSRFKLCLKVQDQQDSNEVLKSPLAAEIKEPGRAYLQVGNNEIFELFQSAYSGAPEKADNSNMKEFQIFALNESGRKMKVFEQKKKKSSEGDLTQLDAIVNYVNGYCENNDIKKLPDICLPSLGENIQFPEKKNLLKADSRVLTEIGIYDDPDNQYQGIYSVDLANQNTMIIGSAQSGKTNMLQTMIRSIATKFSPDEVNLYIIDFASMALKNFEDLNHVGGVVTASDDEKLKNLIKLLLTEIEIRKEKMLAVGVSSFAAYKEAGKTDLPQIVVMIDNLTALKELYFEDDDDVLLTLCREGLTVGITMVIANSQTSGIGYKYLANFSSRIAMFCNDSGEYGSLFDHCRETLNDIHGRCLVEIDKEHLECQAFHSFEGEKEIDKVNEIRNFIKVVNSKNLDKKAKAIPMIPELLTEDFVVDNYKDVIKSRFSLVAGLDYGTVDPVVLQMNNLGSPLVVTGREESGKHNFLKYIVNSLDKIYKDETEVYIIDGIKKKLSPLKDLDNVKTYGFMPDKASDIVTEIEHSLNDRYEEFIEGEDDVLDKSKLIVLIINNYDALENISENQDIYDAYQNITGRYKNMNICVLVGDYENTNISYAAPDLVKELRDERHFMYFDNVSNLKILDLPLSTMREFKKRIDLGDGFYIRDNECMKVKTVKSDI